MTDYSSIVRKSATQLTQALETWESFSSRLSRTVDLFLSKVVRARVLENDPGLRGTLRDRVNPGEKRVMQLRLCGSRANPLLLGGDIDLLLIATTGEHQSQLLTRKHSLLSEIKARIGDQRVDLTITTHPAIAANPVLQSMAAESVPFA